MSATSFFSLRFPATALRGMSWLALAALVQLLSCVPMQTTRRVDVLARHPLNLPPDPAYRASVELDAADAIIRIEPARVCQHGPREEQLVRDTTTRTPELAAPRAIGLAGVALLTTLVVFGGYCHRDDPESEIDQSCLSPFELPFLVYGTAMTATGLAAEWSGQTRRGQTTRTYQRTVEKPLPHPTCSTSTTAAGRTVELDFLSGTMLAATTDAQGTARIPIPEHLWAANPYRLPCRVMVDGSTVTAVILRRKLPPPRK